MYKTIMTVEILSEDPIGSPTLEEVAYEITHGSWSGSYEVSSRSELSNEEMREALIEQGSDPGFFGLD